MKMAQICRSWKSRVGLVGMKKHTIFLWCLLGLRGQAGSHFFGCGFILIHFLSSRKRNKHYGTTKVILVPKRRKLNIRLAVCIHAPLFSSRKFSILFLVCPIKMCNLASICIAWKWLPRSLWCTKAIWPKSCRKLIVSYWQGINENFMTFLVGLKNMAYGITTRGNNT